MKVRVFTEIEVEDVVVLAVKSWCASDKRGNNGINKVGYIKFVREARNHCDLKEALDIVNAILEL